MKKITLAILMILSSFSIASAELGINVGVSAQIGKMDASATEGSTTNIFIFISKSQKNSSGAIYISLFASIATFFLSLFIWYSFDQNSIEFQFIEEKSWINDFIKFKLGVDGISILFIVLTTLITPICIISCINSVCGVFNWQLVP